MAKKINNYGKLIFDTVFKYYGSSANCSPLILYKLLDLNYVRDYIRRNMNNALSHSVEFYGSNPNYNPTIFIKIVHILNPNINNVTLRTILNMNTYDKILINNIIKKNNRRPMIINSRISKRRLMGKLDSASLF
jgi:hypothetical protein